jgi:hypothetical protein
MWLWLSTERFTVRIELTDDNKIKTLPPILYKNYKHFIGHNYHQLTLQLGLSYKVKIRRYNG